MTWQRIIRDAANRRFARTGDCGPFALARRELAELCSEILGSKVDASEWDGPGFVRVQARVPVPELKMQIFVDEWREDDRQR